MSELWNWFEHSVAYVVTMAGIAVMCLVIMRLVA